MKKLNVLLGPTKLLTKTFKMKSYYSIFSLALMLFVLTSVSECDYEPPQPTSTTGVEKATAEVKVQSSGLTLEQENIRNRYKLENSPGSIKHLYVLSAYSGQTILYSTVKGKVTSSGKRLTPYTVAALEGQYVGSDHEGFRLKIHDKTHYTSEVLQDDGTYGSSIQYLYWWDAQDIYHQHYISGGQILHVSDQPIQASGVILNIE